MSTITYSSGQPEKVLVESRAGGAASDVWLRRGIEQDAAGQGPDGAEAAACWKAEEIHYVAEGTPSAAEIEAAFDATWAAHEDDGLTDAERLAKLSQAIQDNTAALIELGDLMGGDE